MDKHFCAAWAPRVLSVLRVITAFLFIQHGTMKMFGVPGMGAPAGAFDPASLMGVAAILEIVGGSLVLIGLFTRPAAFILCGEMAVAYFMAHAPNGFSPLVNHGEAAVLYCFIYLYLAAAGGGAWSVDAAISARTPRPVLAD